MRDPQRIERLSQLLAAAWRETPDMRLGQLLINAIGREADLWNTEDDLWEDALREWIDTSRNWSAR